jgi:ABC-type transport system involved in cytochrome c biogenesis permease subunit
MRFTTAQIILFGLTAILYVMGFAWGSLRLWRKQEPHDGVSRIVWGGFFTNIILILSIVISEGTGHIPNQFDTIIGLTAGIALMSLLLRNYAKSSLTVPVGIGVCTLFILFAGTLMIRHPQSSSTLSMNGWLILHIAMILLSYVVFSMGFITGILFIVQERMVRSKSTGFLWKALPSLERSETISTTSVLIGFPLLTIGIILGIFGGEYLENQLSMPWYQDPEVFLSLLTWIVYGVLLLLRKWLLVKGRKFAYLSVVGFCLILTTVIVGEFLWEGFHQNL